MKHNDPVYRKLQKHLHATTMGYPAVSSGADIRILELLFTPEEARCALLIDGNGMTIGEIENRIAGDRHGRAELAAILDRMAGKGNIEKLEREGGARYRVIPLVVGMWEGQGKRITPEFVRAFRDYTNAGAYGISFLGTELPQMRTIPVGKSVTPELSVRTYDELDRLIDQSDGPFLLFECICRNAKALEGEKCKKTQRLETCMAFGDMARFIHGAGDGRLVDREELRAVAKKNQEEGLVIQPSNTKKIEFICSCCGCCCGMLRWQQEVPRPINFWASNHYAAVNADACTGCRLCEKRCQVGAVKVHTKTKKALVNLERCIGCGLCVTACTPAAIALVKKSRETVPPADAGELNDIIMRNKKGFFGAFGVMKKMFIRQRV